MPRKTGWRGAAFVRVPFDGWPPRRREHGRQGKQRKHHQKRMNGDEQCNRDCEPEDPSTRGEQRHVHVVQHEHLMAQHRQPIEVVGTLLVRDGRNRCQQRRDMGLKRDSDLVAESALNARADGDEEPCRGGGQPKRHDRDSHLGPVALEDTLAEQHEPQRHQRIGQRGQERQREGHEDQGRLVTVAELAQSPHRGERRRQRVDRRPVLRRGRHSSCLPRLRC